MEVCLERDSLSLDWSTDESYVLESDTTDDSRFLARIRSPTFFGARHGLETLSQLVTHTGRALSGRLAG